MKKSRMLRTVLLSPVFKLEPDLTVVGDTSSGLEATGQSLLDADTTKQPMERLHVKTSGSELTEREREVLVLVARGHTNKQLADALYVTKKTARNHVSHILEKLGMSRRCEAAVFAIEHKLVPPREQPAGVDL